MYWIDRDDPPCGNSLNPAFIGDLSSELESEALARRLHETIVLAWDRNTATLHVKDLPGGIYAVDLKTKTKAVLFPGMALA
jgi:hypothetical protein